MNNLYAIKRYIYGLEKNENLKQILLLVFPNKEKDFCRPSQPNDWCDVIATKYNLKRITLHEFRKTHVSLCAMADMKLEDIMYRVGHKDSKITRQVYDYFYPEREDRSADQFAQFIKKEKYLF
ncbi:tyrosine-type recombinase/integrase [Enterococcus sp.]|uniref:tyrosine-type recombinase/integrase n=1 Tax=Enterococcus sp. TaxID=35783 RepID=UPI003421CF6E